MTTTTGRFRPSRAAFARLSPHSRDRIALGIIVLAFLLPLRGLLRSPGPPMEEGFMLVFPEMVIKGFVPNKDFLHLYGPGSLWTLAGIYKVFGVTLLSERMFGLLQEMAVVFGVFALARRWGRSVALTCAITSLVFITTPHGLTALAWVGAVGLGLFALVAAARCREAGDPRRIGQLALVAGLLSGLSLLYRIDLVVALALAMLAIGWGTGRLARRRFGLGLLLGLSPYVVLVAMAGTDNVVRGMILDPVLHLRGGRHLPIPPPWNNFDSAVQYVAEFVKLRWPIPTLNAPAQISLWFFLVTGSIVLLVVVGVWAVRRDREAVRPRVLLAVAGFSVGVFPAALQRADTTHLAWVASVAIAFVPIALLEVLAARRPRADWKKLGVGAGVAVFVALTLAIPNYSLRAYADYAVQTFGVHLRGRAMVHRGRTFYNGRVDDAKAANRLLNDVERISKPGDRVFVGPNDLRKTPLSEAYFYFLLPQLTPATYYIEMDPGVANAKGSGLARDVASADVLILSSAWSYWDEPNDSRKLGSDAPNKVVRDEFCLVHSYAPHFKLYRRCHPKANG